MTTIHYQELPEYFAMLRPTSGGGPSYQICKRTLVQEVHPVEQTEYTYLSVDNSDIQPRQDVERIEVARPNPPPVFQVPVRNSAHTLADVRKIKWWFLPHALQFGDTIVHIIDTNKRFFLPRSFRRIRPSNLTDEQFDETIGIYGAIMDSLGELLGSWSNVYMRDRREEILPLRAPPPQEQQHMPGFVTNLLVKDALEKRQTCPITMANLEEIQTLGITSCYHMFEYQAIQRWRSENRTCPFCRANVSFVQRYDLKN